MKITIQELHAYNKLVELGVAPPIECPINSEHMRTLPWMTEDERVCQRCLACETKVFLSQEAVDVIKLLIYNK